MFAQSACNDLKKEFQLHFRHLSPDLCNMLADK
jgi:hypothetical protein